MNRQPPDRGEVYRIPRFQVGVPAIVWHLFCPSCGRRHVVTSGVAESNPTTVTEQVSTSDGGARTVVHIVPEITVAERACACGSRWSVTQGLWQIAS
jgi:hypothetical protein